MRQRFLRHSLYSTVIILLLVSIYTQIIVAQTINTPFNGGTPPGYESGIVNSLPGTDIDHINPANGTMNVVIPLLRVGGRGNAGYTLSIPIGINWFLAEKRGTTANYLVPDSVTLNPLWKYNQYFDEHKSQNIALLPGIMKAEHIRKISPEDGSCYHLDSDLNLIRFVFKRPDGSETRFIDAKTNGEIYNRPNCDHENRIDRGKIWKAVDGSGMTFVSDEPIKDPEIDSSRHYPGNLFFNDGTMYRINNYGGVDYIRDSNGNKTIFQYEGEQKFRLSYIRDSSGREVFVNYQPTCNGCAITDVIITYKGVGGISRTIKISDKYPNPGDGWLRPDLPGPYTRDQAFPHAKFEEYNPLITPESPRQIILPDGRYYRFWYNAYGEVARVDLPAGGRIEYDWGAGYSASYPDGLINDYETHPGQRFARGIFRVVTQRRVYTDATSTIPVEQMHISRGGGNLPTVIQYVVPGSSPIVALRTTKMYYTGDPDKSFNFKYNNLYLHPLDNKAYKVEQYDGEGLKRTIDYILEDATGGPRLRSETTTLHDVNLVSRRNYDYDNYHNVIGVREYDYGISAPGSLVRRTSTSYLTTNPNQGGANYTDDPTIHITGLPTETSVFDGNGNQLTKTTFDYDLYSQQPLQDAPNIVQHDSTYSTGYGYRGNLVKQTTYLNITSSTSITTYKQYDIAGNVVKTIDGNGNTTIIDYTDRYGTAVGEARSNTTPPGLGGGMSYALPTRVTNAIGHQGYIKYDYYTGKPVDAEDTNGLISSTYYNDILERPTQLIKFVNDSSSPSNKSQSTITYNDSSHIVTTTSDQNTYGDNLLKSETISDGLGRPIETRNYETSTSYISTLTQYDSLGRPYKISSPFRAGETINWTTKSYDGFGRVINVRTDDGPNLWNTYNGNQVTVTDQAGKRTTSISDALGRLTKIIEDPNGLNYETTYSYDALGNLRQVNQGGQPRTFIYDSLSRLISSTNPESGTISYSYDANTNLIKKTDTRNVNTIFSYDALNRKTSKTYSGNTTEATVIANQTPIVNYYYDNYSTLPGGAPALSGGAPIGKLIGVTYGGGASGTYYKYDAIGRMETAQQIIGSGNYPTSYTYDLAGHIIRENRKKRINSMAYDNAGRLSSVDTSAYPYTVFYVISNNIQHTSYGAIQQETYGNNLVHTIQYNSHKQPIEIDLGPGSSPTNTMSLKYIYGTVNNPNDPDQNIDISKNNGNIGRMKYSIGGIVQNAQTYQYDGVNRLLYAVEHNNANYSDTTRAWYQTFQYDQYGNRGINYAGTMDNADANNTALQLSDFSASNNRITRTGFIYDAAGNLITEAGKTYTYDAENRLVTASVGGATIQYVYDGNSRRVKKIVNNGSTTVATRYIYGGDGLLQAEYNDSTGALLKEYLYRMAKLIATNVPQQGIQFATADHLGSPRMWTDWNGNVVTGGRHDYMPFGEELLSGYGNRTTSQNYEENIQQDGQRNQFTGYEQDTETKLNFAQARYHSSMAGRFTSPDPLMESAKPSIPQSWNRYSYCINNPLKYIDPEGLDWYSNDKGVAWFEKGKQSKGYELFTPVGNQYTDTSGRIVILNSNGPNSSAPRGSAGWHGWSFAEDNVSLPVNLGVAEYYSGYRSTANFVNSFKLSGGGAFGYAGVGGAAGPVHGEGLALVQYDSEEGGSHGALVGAGAGKYTLGVESMRTWSNWQEHTSPIALGGIEMPGSSSFFGKKLNTHTRDIGGLVQYEHGHLSLGVYGGVTMGSHRTVGGGFYFTFSWR